MRVVHLLLCQVLVIGATNRSDLLDDALLRPGRFDEIITLDLPDASSRKEIFHIYLRGRFSGCNFMQCT